VRIGQALLAADVGTLDDTSGDEAGSGSPTVGESSRVPAWHAPLGDALLGGRITAAQHDAIRRGLGEPPRPVATSPTILGEDATPELSAQVRAVTVAEVWSLAARQMIDEAGTTTVEELRVRARLARDLLDPEGANERFLRRYEARAFRVWTDADGVQHARIDFDDEMGAWVQSILAAALRPRRGGPRFVDPAEQRAADALTDDPRTNDQLAYDLMMDVLRAGALASEKDGFGARQPGVRIVVVKDGLSHRDAFGRLLATAHLEDGGAPIAGTTVDRTLCVVGSTTITVDGSGNPLDVGREQRLFTSRQRIALAARDGGCLWPMCDRPASSCELHHCDHYAEGGRTDTDRGIMLCRHHHMAMHHHGWRITRQANGAFVLHPPPGRAEPIELHSRSGSRWAWDPPPRSGTGWRAA